MSAESIKKNLSVRFAAPLPEFYRRRIIFWPDPGREFESVADEVCPEGVQLVKLTGSNSFGVKMLLAETDTTGNYLVYNPVSYDSPQDNRLRDIELYSEEFRADFLSMQMEELHIAASPAMRRVMKEYGRFFNSRERRQKLLEFGREYADPADLRLDITAVLCGLRRASVPDIIGAVLTDGLDRENNGALLSIGKFGSMQDFRELLSRYTGYEDTDGRPLLQLAAHVFMTALAQTMNPSHLSGFPGLISGPHRQYCYSMVHEWLTGAEDDRFYDICREIEERYGLPERFDALETEELAGSECFPCINECILRRFLNEIAANVIRIDAIVETVEKRRTLKWYKRVAGYYEGILQIAKIAQFSREHAEGFHIVEAEAIWKKYAKEYYRMDSCYRLFIASFHKSLKYSSTVLEDAYKAAAEYAEGLYRNRFLGELSDGWTAAAGGQLAERGAVGGVVRQEDFYRNFVAPVVSDGSRAFVIVSDALRYEAAASLAEVLTRDTKGSTTLHCLQAVLPTVTGYGMAALLPHLKLELDAGLRVIADGMPTDGIAAREKVLKAANRTAAAVRYQDFIAMKMAERREKLGSAEVVYIWHNTVDAAGDKASSEAGVFEACGEAAEEIKNLVRIITNELSGTNILITADHGFLYTRSPLTESLKLGVPSEDPRVREAARRYIIAENGFTPEHMMPFSLERIGGTGLTGFAPAENIRLKIRGGGENYVHGGVSLQEMAVPVIVFKNMRAGSKKFVEAQKVQLQLLSESRRISNNIFSLDFLQKDPAGGKKQPCSYEICVCDAAGEAVSDRRKVIADRTDANPNNRIFRVQLTLKAMPYSRTDRYYLTVADADSREVLSRTEFEINIAFTSDF